MLVYIINQEEKVMFTERVIYKGKEYMVLKKYESGYCEIKELEDNHKIELVHISELTSID
jgi:phage antirepressor YoqD-like protein